LEMYFSFRMLFTKAEMVIDSNTLLVFRVYEAFKSLIKYESSLELFKSKLLIYWLPTYFDKSEICIFSIGINVIIFDRITSGEKAMFVFPKSCNSPSLSVKKLMFLFWLMAIFGRKIHFSEAIMVASASIPKRYESPEFSLTGAPTSFKAPVKTNWF